MDYEKHEQLCSELRSQVGTSLRAIGFYTPETKRIVYLNDDVAATTTPEQAEKLVTYFQQRTDMQEVYDAVGVETDLRCDVHLFDDHLWIHLPFGPETGTIIVTAPSIAESLSSFVETCRSNLD